MSVEECFLKGTGGIIFMKIRKRGCWGMRKGRKLLDLPGREAGVFCEKGDQTKDYFRSRFR